MEHRDSGRSLSLIVSSLILTYHAATAYLCTYMPSDPLYVSVSVTGYAWYGCAMSLLGVAGSLKKSPTLLTVFSNHLFIDTVISLVPKIGLLYLFHDLTSDLCINSLSASYWMPSDTASGSVLITADNSKQWSQAMRARRHCEAGISISRVLLLAILVLWTAAQWGLGLYIRRYAVRVDIHDRISRRASYAHREELGAFCDEEKAVLMEEEEHGDYGRWGGDVKDLVVFEEKEVLEEE